MLLELSALSAARGDEERSQELLESAFVIASETDAEARALESALRRSGRTLDLVRAVEARVARAPSAGAYTDLADALDERAERPADAFAARLAAVRAEPSKAEAHDAALAAAERLGEVGTYTDALRQAASRVEEESA